ncbi:methyltransferase [Candidatus Woesearchaeota archaeon]|nr:methyltransferase [Candidatus Woesearchaeota archaeon]
MNNSMPTTDAVYQPAEDSYLLQEYVKEYAFGRVLDMGTGSGIQALTALKRTNVKEVVAVDIDEEAVRRLQQGIKEQRLRKIKVIKSDLFDRVEGHFNLIIFNPPYLPQDEGIEDQAIYGGKKGWEVIGRFLQEVSAHLFADGKVLLLFSSLTHRDKVDERLSYHLLDFELLGQKKLSFEELFVYVVVKSGVLRELEAKGIEKVNYLTHGKRGNVFTGILDKNKLRKTHLSTNRHSYLHNIVKVAIKVQRPESEAPLDEEAKWLVMVNEKGIGPRLLFSGKGYVVYEFVEGEYLVTWIQNQSKETIRKVLDNLLKQCFALDILGINKEEMHHPVKHIIIDKNHHSVMLDFERCYKTDNPKNVTQFIDFICRLRPELQKKEFSFTVEELRGAAGRYKKERSIPSFEEVRALLG